MLPQAEDIEPHLIGKLDLFQKVLQATRTFRATTISRVRIDIGKGVKTKFHGALLAQLNF